MKTKPHQLGLYARASQMSACHQSLSVFTQRSFSAQNPKGATIGGPLQNPWPPSNLVSELETKGDQGIMIPLEISLIPFDSSQPVTGPVTPDIDPESKGCHLPPKKVATFEEVGNLSFLTQKRKMLRSSPKK